MDKIRAAVIGVGYLGRFHAQKYAQIPGCELVAVVDGREAVRNAVAAEVGSQPHADYRELLGKVDAVVTDPPYGQAHKVNTFHKGGTRDKAVVQRNGGTLMAGMRTIKVRLPRGLQDGQVLTLPRLVDHYPDRLVDLRLRIRLLPPEPNDKAWSSRASTRQRPVWPTDPQVLADPFEGRLSLTAHIVTTLVRELTEPARMPDCVTTSSPAPKT